MSNTSITFTLDQSILDMFITAVTATKGYQAKLPDGSDNPQSPLQFAQQQVINFCIEVTTAYNVQQAAEAARQAAIAAAQATINSAVITVS